MTSWVIVEKGTGKAVMETFNPQIPQRLNTERFRAVPVTEYLADLNRRIKAAGGCQP